MNYFLPQMVSADIFKRILLKCRFLAQEGNLITKKLVIRPEIEMFPEFANFQVGSPF